jgi:hypothetical protein
VGTNLVTTVGWGTLTVPDPGEAVRAATMAGAVRPGYQELLNRIGATAYGLRNVTRCWCEAPPDLVIQPLGWVFLRDNAGIWKMLEHSTPSTIDVDAIIGGGGPAADTRYFVYAYENGGAIDFDIFTDPPDDQERYRDTGVPADDTKYAFVTTIYGNDAGTAIMRYQHQNRTITYWDRTPLGGGTGGNLLLDNGSAVIQTTVVMNGSVWADRAKSYIMHCRHAGSAVAGTAFVGRVGFTYEFATIYTENGTTGANNAPFPFVPGVTTEFDYKVPNIGNGLSCWIAEFSY